MLRLLVLAVLSLLYVGCSVSDEDRDFYYRGWVNPNEPRRWNSQKLPPPSDAPPAGYKRDPLVD